jgi:hypothetical protein
MSARFLRGKYGNKRAKGYASGREAKRAAELQLLQKVGEIRDLEYQKKYVLIPKQDGERACTYTADFVYFDKAGKLHVEDAKGFKTQQYIIRRKLMKFIHGIKIEEV